MKDTETSPAATEVLVCTTCRMGQTVPEGGVRPGALLLAAIQGRALPAGVTVRGVECLSNCDSGCSIVLRGGPARWSYVYGRLAPAMADIAVDGVTRYHHAADGLVPWRERPEHFRKNCIARIPPLEISDV